MKERSNLKRIAGLVPLLFCLMHSFTNATSQSTFNKTLTVSSVSDNIIEGNTENKSVSSTSLYLNQKAKTPKEFKLSHHRDPLTGKEILTYELPANAKVSLKIYDISQQPISTLR